MDQLTTDIRNINTGLSPVETKAINVLGLLFPDLSNIAKPSFVENAMDLLVPEEDDNSRIEDLIEDLNLALEILQNSNTVNDLEVNIDQMHQSIKDEYDNNLQTIKEEIVEHERMLRTIELCYKNAGSKPEVWILPIPKEGYDEELVEQHLRDQYYAWEMKRSPLFFLFASSIKAEQFVKYALLAEETSSMFIADLPKSDDIDIILQTAEAWKITGSQSYLGNVIVPATWLYTADGYEDSQKTQPMAVPAGCAMLGRLLKEGFAGVVTSLEAQPIMGIQPFGQGAVLNYGMQRKDAKTLSQAGMVQITDQGYIQGTATAAAHSTNKTIKDFLNSALRNYYQKILIQFGNYKAFQKLDEPKLVKEIQKFFNSEIQKDHIQTPCPIPVVYYDADENVVQISVTLKYHSRPETFVFSI